MGCSQSHVIRTVEITKEEARQIPHIFRDSSKYNSSPGLKYWFDTCKVKEGKIPMKVNNKEYTADYVCVSKYGFYPMDVGRTTQDSYSLMTSTFSVKEKEVSGVFLGVFDGHGDFGGECSSFCKEFIDKKMCQKATLSESSSVGPYISDALQECNKEMHDKKIHGELNDTNSGTTAVCLSIIDDEVICVNVGDSRCMAGYCTPDNCIIPIPLSIDQTPIRLDERERVQACGADVCTVSEKLPGMRTESPMNMNSMTFSPEDPPRIYLKNCGYPGAAFSRSIGDSIAESVGVIAEGEIMMKKLEKGVNHLIVASDGLWNLCIPEDLVTNLRYTTDLAKTAVSMVLSTFLRWIQLYGSSDDITLLALRLPELDDDLNENCQDWIPKNEKEDTIF